MSICEACGQQNDAESKYEEAVKLLATLDERVDRLLEIISDLASEVNDAAASAKHQAERV